MIQYELFLKFNITLFKNLIFKYFTKTRFRKIMHTDIITVIQLTKFKFSVKLLNFKFRRLSFS